MKYSFNLRIAWFAQKLPEGPIIQYLKYLCSKMEVRGFEPRASRMQSERSTTELHPQYKSMLVL